MPKKTSTTKAEGQAAPAASTDSKLPAEQRLQATSLQYIEGQLAGVQLHDGTVVTLAELPEADLRQIATDMEIDGADTLTVEQLVAAIQGEPVLVNEAGEAAGDDAGVSLGPTSVSAGDALPHIAGEDGRYQVLLTDGSLAYLEELPKEDLVELAAACLHLAPPGLGGAQFIGMDLARAETAMEALKRGMAETSRYVVCRERLDHNDESYARGEVIQFDDEDQARQLLAISAIAPEVI